MAQQEIEVILLRQLASHLATPVLVVDRDGSLLFFNEAAEVLLGRRFDETEDMRSGEFAALFQPTDEAGAAVKFEDQPLSLALASARPAHRQLWIRTLDGVRRAIEVTAFPILGQSGRHLGAFALFWETGGT